MSSEPSLLPNGTIHATQVKDIILRHIFD